jgi:hypothetical protein
MEVEMKYDKRCSKETLLTAIQELQEKVETVYEVGMNGIAYVGASNYAHRESKAKHRLNVAMYGSD